MPELEVARLQPGCRQTRKRRLRVASCGLAFVASVLRTGAALAQEAAPTTPVDAQEGRRPESSASPTTWISLEAPAGVRLEQDPTGGKDWSLVCNAPCSMAVPSASSYRIVGRGVRRSNVFTLRAPPGVPETLAVKTASSTLLTVGAVGSVAGLTSFFVGSFGYEVWAMSEAVANALAYAFTAGRAQASEDSPPLWIPVTIVGGAVLAVAGLVLVAMNERTHVQQVFPGSETMLPHPPMPPRIHSGSPEPSRFPTVAFVPLFAGTF